MDARTLAVDLVKNVFQLAFANRAGRIIDRRRLSRRQFARWLETVAVGTDVHRATVSRCASRGGCDSADSRRRWSWRATAVGGLRGAG